MQKSNGDLFTEDNFPIQRITVSQAMAIVHDEMEAVAEDHSPTDLSIDALESLIEFQVVAIGMLELMVDMEERGRYNPTSRLDEGLIQAWSLCPTPKDYLGDASEGEAHLRRALWSWFEDRCATCGDPVDYCQGHGVLG